MKVELDNETRNELIARPCTYCIRYESNGNGWVSMRYGFEDKQPDGGQSENLTAKSDTVDVV